MYYVVWGGPTVIAKFDTFDEAYAFASREQAVETELGDGSWKQMIVKPEEMDVYSEDEFMSCF